MVVSRCLLVCAMFALSTFLSTPVFAQVTGATLVGTVTDPSGGQVPNANVSIKNRATGVERDFEHVEVAVVRDPRQRLEVPRGSQLARF